MKKFHSVFISFMEMLIRFLKNEHRKSIDDFFLIIVY